MQPLEQWYGWDFMQEPEFSQCGRWVTMFALFSRANDSQKEFVGFIDHFLCPFRGIKVLWMAGIILKKSSGKKCLEYFSWYVKTDSSQTKILLCIYFSKLVSNCWGSKNS